MDFVERHFDYVLGPGQDSRLALVKAGQTIEGVTLRLDPDAPFELRSRALRCKFTTDGTDQAGLNHVLARWYGPDRNYTSQGMVRQSLLSPYFGQVGNPIPVSPKKYYPPDGEIRVDLTNDGAADITNLTFYFRGVKYYRPGAVKAYGYPSTFGLLPFVYTPPATAALAAANPNGALPLIVVPVTTGNPGPFFTFRNGTDADFVLQGLQSGFTGTGPALEIFLTLKDEDEKPYSNAPVHISVLCGNSFGGNIFPVGSSTHIAPVAGGPNAMGLLFPEIYIPRNHNFYFNVQRDDSAYDEPATINLPISFIGTKVFDKS